MIKNEILITVGLGWPVSSDKWKVPLVKATRARINRFSTMISNKTGKSTKLKAEFNRTLKLKA